MSEKKGDNSKKQQILSSPPNEQNQEISDNTEQRGGGSGKVTVVPGGASPQFVPPPPLYIPTTSGSFETSSLQQQFESLNPKRARYTTGQWKQLHPSPSQPQKQSTQSNVITESSTPSPSPHAKPATVPTESPDAVASPVHSPKPSHSAVSCGQETSRPSDTSDQAHRAQFRKGKYVSPVWKPNEMLCLAKAWKVQYQGGGAENADGLSSSRGKTRAEKDREVAEFLHRHRVNRDAKTAGTKWDNMLGEFRKVYEWERGGERDQIGKSYFRLSPYERKIHRLPASFDEEVFEELAQFMGSRMRSSHSRGGSSGMISGGSGGGGGGAVGGGDDIRSPFKDEETPLSARARQMVGVDQIHHGTRGTTLGFESTSSALDMLTCPSYQVPLKEAPRRVGKIRMIWEESVNLWAEEGEQHNTGRIKLDGSNFLNADELAYLDETMVACNMEAFEDGPLKGFSVDRFIAGQQIKIFGRKKQSSLAAISSGSGSNSERIQLRTSEPVIRHITKWDFQDPTEYYLSCLRVPPSTLPSLFELSWHIQEPPPEALRFPIRRDLFKDLPFGKELFFTTSNDPIDCSRSISFDILSAIMRPNPSLSTTSRDSFIGLWDDCINRMVSKFCPIEMVFVRKPPSSSLCNTIQDQWPSVSAFLRNFCLWRGEEIDQPHEGHPDPSSLLVEKILWTYMGLPYILGYYAIGHIVTFCALSRAHDLVIRTDLYTVDLSVPAERLKALIPCWRIAGLLPLLADRCVSYNANKLMVYSDFERINLGEGNIIEMTPNLGIRFFSNKTKWSAVKEIYDFLDQRIPHAEFLFKSSENDLALVFKPRGCKSRPETCDQLVEALKSVTKALVALHDLSFMHRDLSWDKVMRGMNGGEKGEWFVSGFDEAVAAPQIYPRATETGGCYAPEMGRGLHGVKVDVWGVGQLVKTSGLVGVPKLLRDLQNKCLEHNPEQRPTAADCYHHLLQLQSSTAAGGGGGVY